MHFAALLLLASATPESRLVAAERALTASEFERATREAEALISAEVLDKAQSARAQRTAAFAQFYLGERQVAEMHLNEYLKLVPDAQIDSKRSPPDLVTFFNEVKDKRSPPTVVPSPRPSAAAASTPTARHFNPVALVPFGIGQLLLGDKVGGAIFLSVDAVLFAADLTLYFVRVKDRLPGNAYANPGRAEALQIGQDIAAGALIVSTVIGVVDAIAWAPGRVAAHPLTLMVAPVSQGAVLTASVRLP